MELQGSHKRLNSVRATEAPIQSFQYPQGSIENLWVGLPILALSAVGAARFASSFLGSVDRDAHKRWRAAVYFVIAGALYGIAFVSTDGSHVSALWACLGVVLLAIAEIDARSFLVPDILVVIVAVLALSAIYLAHHPEAELSVRLLGGALAGGILAVVAAGFVLLKGHQGLGLGDIKLAAAGGLWAPWQHSAEMLLMAALLGIVMALIRGGGRVDRSARIPFAPALALAIAIASLSPVLELT